MPLGIDFGGGGKGGFNFGDFEGGDIRGGPVSIDARTTTGGGDPELIGQNVIAPVVTVIAIAVVAYLVIKKKV